MSDIISNESNTNWLFSLSLKRPVLVMLILFILACLLKILDSFIFRLDELVGEAIFTKALGFVLVAVYVWACGRKLRDIGFHTRFLGKALLIAAVSLISLYIIAFTAQMIVLRSTGEDASFVLSAIDPKTGMSGGLLFAIWLLVANLVNSAMEEGLFRGTMIRHFLIRFSGWGAIILQAGLFALWHMSWPARNLLDGNASFGQAANEALVLLVGTSIAGVVYGYLYLKTDNLWSPFLAHTINNGIFNVLFFRTNMGMQSGLEFGLFLAIFLIGHLLLIPVFRFASKRLEMPEVKPWGEFGEDDRDLTESVTP
ncbi:lysostaphin resistance A-like protein [Chloroflexota bacterium]